MLAAYVLKTFDSHLTELFSRFSDLDHAERYFLTPMAMNCVCTLLQALLKSASVFLPLSTVFSISMQTEPIAVSIAYNGRDHYDVISETAHT